MKKILFIINPISGIGKQKIVESLIGKHLDKEKFSSEIVYTKYAKHAIELSKEASSGNDVFDIVVAVGGDGSINEVSQGLIGSNTVLGVLPAGSGNGLARFLKIPLDLKKAILNLNKEETKRIDTLKVNDVFAVNVAGIGFDAEISHRFATYGKRGFWAYLKLVLKSFFSYKNFDCEFELDGEKLSKKAFLISCANSSQFGFNAHIAPLAKIDDGFFDICILRKFPVWAGLGITFRLFGKSFHKSKFMETKQAKRFSYKKQGEIIAQIDGEAIAFKDELNIEINPSSLNIIVGE